MSLLKQPTPPAPLGQVREVRKLNAKEIDEEERAERAAARAERQALKAGKQTPQPSSAARPPKAPRIGDQILALIGNRALTCIEIASESGLTISHVHSTLRRLKDLQLAHIASFRSGKRVSHRYRAGPSPVGPAPFPYRLPTGHTVTVLLTLRAGALRFSEVVNAAPECASGSVSAILNHLVITGWAAKSGNRHGFQFALTEAGRALADYITKLEEVYPCS